MIAFLHDLSSRRGYVTDGNHFVYELLVVVWHKLSSMQAVLELCRLLNSDIRQTDRQMITAHILQESILYVNTRSGELYETA